MRRLTFIITTLLSVSLAIMATNIQSVDLAGRLTGLGARSNVESVSVTWDGEYINIYFQINLEQIAIEIVNLSNDDIVYSGVVNSYLDKNLCIDLSAQAIGEYKIVFINIDSGDFMYGQFSVEK